MDPRAQILDHVALTPAPSIPESARQSLRIFLLDTVGVGLAGSSAAGADELVAASANWGSGALPVLGRDIRVSREVACLLNAFFIHNLEWDCVHEPAVVHAMSVITACCLTEAASNPQISGSDLAAAIILGVDIAASLGVATEAPLRFFRPGTNGCLGAALALARLRGLPRTHYDDVFGLTYSQLSGTMQAHVEGSITLPLQIAMAARSAMTAVDMAEAGLTAPHDVLDGEFGFFKLIEDGGSAAAAARRLGDIWAVTELSHKPYPSGRASHAVLEYVLRKKADLGFGFDDVAQIKAQVPPLIHRLVARPYQAGMTPAYARLCLPNLCGLAMRDAAITPAAGAQENLAAPELAAFAQRVEITIDANTDLNAMRPQAAQIILKDGRDISEPIPAIYGAPGYPMTEQDYLAKFDLAARFAHQALSPAQVLALRTFLQEIDQQPSVAAMYDMLKND
ncbi:MAG: MmgE/PrpD family protein [Pseudomonadota bacterium]